MKLFVLVLTLIISLPGLAHVQRLSYNAHNLQVKPVVMKRQIQTNLIRLYMRMPSEMRMIAGHKEIKNISKTSWLDGLRSRLKTSNGQIRL